LRKKYTKFKKKYKLIHVLLIATAIVMFWRGVWGLLDEYLLVDEPLASYALSILIAFVVLFADSYYLDELT